MTTLITNSKFKQFDANGEPLAAGKIYTYIVGTTTEKVTYQDQEKIAAHDNPIVLDSWGEATIWIDGDTKFVVSDSDDVVLRTYDSFSDTTTGATEYPVNPSPDGAVYRSTITETGYIKIQLPMGEWPNTKMMFDLIVYDDFDNEALKLTIAGFANSTGTTWENVTALTNGYEDIVVQFGNDGVYPSIYIGEVSTQWIKPQIAIANFLAGEFSYDWTTWDNGWVISVTTSLGTITDSTTAEGRDSITNTIGWGAWQTPTYLNGWLTYTSSTLSGFRYRLSNDGENVQFSGSITGSAATASTVMTLPAAYRPTDGRMIIPALANTGDGADDRSLSIATDGTVLVVGYAAAPYSFNDIFPTT